MKKLAINPSNKKYYSDDYIKGWEDGVKAQYEATKDAVEVVRCGHCEWWKCNPNTEEYGVCKKVSYDDFEVVMNCDDFCSYGKRREP